MEGYQILSKHDRRSTNKWSQIRFANGIASVDTFDPRQGSRYLEYALGRAIDDVFSRPGFAM